MCYNSMVYTFMKKGQTFFKLLFLTSILFFCFASCKDTKVDGPRLYLAPYFTWCETDEASTCQDVINQKDQFKPLRDMSTKNIQNLFKDDGQKGLKGHYLWIRIDFEIPENLKNRSLGLNIPYLRMAEKTYLNGNFIGEKGSFPPHERSALYSAHYHALPEGLLNQEGNNVLLIKVWSHGQSGISQNTFIGETKDAVSSAGLTSFFNCYIYAIFQGGLLISVIFFMFMAIGFGNNPAYRFFALINLSTFVFLLPFSADIVPWQKYIHIQYFTFMKITLCMGLEANFYLLSFFIAEFLEFPQPKQIKGIRLLLFVTSEIIILATKNYDALMNISIMMIIMIFIHISFGVAFWIISLIKKYNIHNSIVTIECFIPVLLGIVIDVVIRRMYPTVVFPFFTLILWQGTIIIFIFIMARRTLKLFRSNISQAKELKILNENLDEEVRKRTHELEDANYELSVLNERLEKEKFRSDMDLEMASVIQRKFFPQPNKIFKGWQIAILYEPLAKVSGDLYDYYNFNEYLNGLSLFDVSGHGISASLITMLSKNIISHTFQKGYRKSESVEKMLYKINNQIIREKGNIDNYLTGILCRFGNFEKDDSCSVEMGNAGHPYPLLFSKKDALVKEITKEEGQIHYGAIGMRGMDVSYPETKFKIQVGDILVFYTDGITESSNKESEQFGLKRVKNIIAANSEKSPNEILNILTWELAQFTDGKPLEDDITIIILKRTDSSLKIEQNYEEEDEEEYEDYSSDSDNYDYNETEEIEELEELK